MDLLKHRIQRELHNDKLFNTSLPKLKRPKQQQPKQQQPKKEMEIKIKPKINQNEHFSQWKGAIGKVLGQKIVPQIFSEDPAQFQKALIDINWGLDSFNFDLISDKEKQDILYALFVVINKGCNDSNTQVKIQALNLLLNVVNSYMKNFEELTHEVQKNFFDNHISMIMDSLIVQLGSSSPVI